MELYKELLLQILSEENMQISFNNLNVNELLESVCYRTLCRIKEIIEDDTLDDPECFMKIEEIVCVLEEVGSSGGIRHDFG